MRATMQVDEVDKQIPDVVTPCSVASRGRTLRKIIYLPAAPGERTVELTAELALGTRTKLGCYQQNIKATFLVAFVGFALVASASAPVL